MSREGPWTWEQIEDRVSMSGGAPWHGGAEPPRIEPRVNPGALVAVLLRPDDTEWARWLLEPGNPTAGVDEAAAACSANPALRVCIYDGDSGRPVVVLRVPE